MTSEQHPAIGGTLRYEGHDYRITGHPPVTDDVVAFLTAAGQSAPDQDTRFLVFERVDPRTPNKSVVCNAADVKDSGEGWYYLPGRVGPPLAGDQHNGKQLSPAFPAHLREMVRSHPDYVAGRDDLAAEAVAKTNKADWPVHLSDERFAQLHTLRTPKEG